MATAEIITGGSSLAEALIAFQADLPEINLDSQNPHFKSRFASLPNITKIVLPKLSKHGLAFSATPNVGEHGFVMEAHLIHTSGERLSASFPITATDPQKVGSSVTYYRRYALAALTGIVADADDDGNAASIPTPTERQLDKARSAAPATAPGGGEMASLNARIRKYFDGDAAKKQQVNDLLEGFKKSGKNATEARKALISELSIPE